MKLFSLSFLIIVGTLLFHAARRSSLVVLGEYVLYLAVHEHSSWGKFEFPQHILSCHHLVVLALVAKGSPISMVNSPLRTQHQWDCENVARDFCNSKLLPECIDETGLE